MKTVKKTSIFPVSKKKVFAKLLKLSTLQYIAYPYATFTPLDGTDNMSWEVGSTSRFKFRLFGFIPFGTHTINVIRFGSDEGIYTHEHEDKGSDDHCGDGGADLRRGAAEHLHRADSPLPGELCRLHGGGCAGGEEGHAGRGNLPAAGHGGPAGVLRLLRRLPEADRRHRRLPGGLPALRVHHRPGREAGQPGQRPAVAAAGVHGAGYSGAVPDRHGLVYDPDQEHAGRLDGHVRDSLPARRRRQDRGRQLAGTARAEGAVRRLRVI